MTLPRRLPALLVALLITATHAFVASPIARRPTIAPLRSSRDEPLFLCEEHVAIALEELKAEYDAVFHQDASLKMSGDVRLEAIEGCDVTLRLFGLFWHSRPVVFGLAANYLAARIPEIADVVPFSEANVGDDDRLRSPDFNGDRREIERLGHEPDEVVVIRHRPGLTFTGYNIY